MSEIRIGISGWRYAPWRGVFYPPDLAQARELEFASRLLPTIEINGSFYSLQRPQSYQGWYDATPPGFVFAHKGNRYLTHILRLRDPEKALANVFASGVLLLREKLGPFLWQLPPNFTFDAGRVEHFLSLLPHDSAQALTLAQGHEARMQGRTALEIDSRRPLRHAIEIRHESFNDPAFIRLLRHYRVMERWALRIAAWADGGRRTGGGCAADRGRRAAASGWRACRTRCLLLLR